jgi:hypothetical protein
MIRKKAQSVGVVMMILGIILALYFSLDELKLQSNLIEIKREKSISIIVNDAYNERGVYILSDKYFVNSATYIIGDDYSLSKDDAIWRRKDKKYKPRISDVSAPFKIYKEKNSDTLRLIKEDKTIILVL